MSAPSRYARTHVLYSVPIQQLTLTLDGNHTVDVSHLLTSGRSNYLLFQRLTGWCAALQDNSDSKDSDLVSTRGDRVEVKAYHDHELHPGDHKGVDRIHVAASSTHPANNHGPVIDQLLKAGDYPAALQLCVDTGYSRNAMYVFTNTRSYAPGVPFRYLILPTGDVTANLHPDDPRLVSREQILKLVRRRVTVPAEHIVAASLTQ